MKHRSVLKRCSRCKQASYCGKACQNAAWTEHKKTCKTLQDVRELVRVAKRASDWRGVLKWGGRMDELVEGMSDDTGRDGVLSTFMKAHMELDSTDGVLMIELRRFDLLGKMERFRDQGRALCHIAHCHHSLGRPQEAERCFQRARDIGAAHGFFSVECKACEGLGYLAMREGRHQEGVDLLHNALAGPCPRLPWSLNSYRQPLNPEPSTPRQLLR